jgi:hypothetical protein
MSASAITLVDFVESFEAKTNSLDLPDIHPGGARTIYHWLYEMRWAAEAERADEVAKWAQNVSEEVALEKEWSCASG